MFMNSGNAIDGKKTDKVAFLQLSTKMFSFIIQGVRDFVYMPFDAIFHTIYSDYARFRLIKQVLYIAKCNLHPELPIGYISNLRELARELFDKINAKKNDMLVEYAKLIAKYCKMHNVKLLGHCIMHSQNFNISYQGYYINILIGLQKFIDMLNMVIDDVDLDLKLFHYTLPKYKYFMDVIPSNSSDIVYSKLLDDDFYSYKRFFVSKQFINAEPDFVYKNCFLKQENGEYVFYYPMHALTCRNLYINFLDSEYVKKVYSNDGFIKDFYGLLGCVKKQPKYDTSLVFNFTGRFKLYENILELAKDLLENKYNPSQMYFDVLFIDYVIAKNTLFTEFKLFNWYEKKLSNVPDGYKFKHIISILPLKFRGVIKSLFKRKKLQKTIE